MFLFFLRIPFILTLSCSFAFAAEGSSSQVGRRFPSEMRTFTDSVTGRKIKALTTSSFNDQKPYQTHPTWTSDGQWIVFRSDRAGPISQAFVVNETSGEIIQITDDPTVSVGSINLSRKEMKVWVMRGGFNASAAGSAEPSAAPPPPREMIEINLGALIKDSLEAKMKAPSAYQRVVGILPPEYRDAGGFAIDADESKAYWGIGPAPAAPTHGARSEFEKAQLGSRAALDTKNMDPTEPREAARARFAAAGKGPGGIRSVDLKTGEIKKVIDVDFRMGHLQTNPWVPGEILYCHETGGDAPQRMWAVMADGSNNRPIYVESPDEWITHETFSARDEVMFLIIGHLPYLREKPTGIAVINLRDRQMRILGQLDEDMGGGLKGGLLALQWIPRRTVGGWRHLQG